MELSFSRRSDTTRQLCYGDSSLTSLPHLVSVNGNSLEALAILSREQRTQEGMWESPLFTKEIREAGQTQSSGSKSRRQRENCNSGSHLSKALA